LAQTRYIAVCDKLGRALKTYPIATTFGDDSLDADLIREALERAKEDRLMPESELVSWSQEIGQGVKEYEMTTRRRFTGEFKARVALEALRGSRAPFRHLLWALGAGTLACTGIPFQGATAIHSTPKPGDTAVAPTLSRVRNWGAPGLSLRNQRGTPDRAQVAL
jgi:hypothetical protein